MAPSALEKAVNDRSTTSDLLDYLETEMTNHATVALTEPEVLHLLAQVNAAQTDIMEIHRRIQASCIPTDMPPHQTEFQRLLKKSLKLLSSFTAMKASFTSTSATAASSSSTSSSTSSSKDIRLPRLELPTFDGKLEEWVSFRDMFVTAVRDNTSLSKSQKLTYLKSKLKGEAARQISSMLISDANFDIAWAQLTDRYQNDRELLFAILRKFMNQKAVLQQSSSSMRSLIDVSRECIRTLDVLLLPTDQWDAILLFIIVTKMDSSSKELWEHGLKDSSIPTLNSLFEFLEQRARALAASGGDPPPGRLNSRPNPPQSGAQTRSQSRTLVHHTAGRTFGNCKCCETSSHPLYKCEKFNGLSVELRNEMVRTLMVCFNCFGSHRVTECRSSKGCRTCNGKHHTLLHNPPANQPPPAVVHFTTPELIATVPNEFDTLLATCMVQVADKQGQFHNFRVLADNGSNTNYVTDSCIKRIGAPRKRCFTSATGLGGASVANATGTTHFKVSPHFDSTFSFEISRCLITTKITGKLPTSTFDHTKWPHLQGLQLADPGYHKPQEVDMLLGAEFFFAILEGGKSAGPPNSPVAIETSFGWLIGGGSQDVPLIDTKVHATLSSNSTASTSTSLASDQDEHLDATLKKFWEIEAEPAERLPTLEHKQIESHFMSTYKIDEDGRFIVQLPLKTPVIRIGSSLNLATKRLHYLERRLARNLNHKKEYTSFMQEYEDLGHMEEVQPEENPNSDTNKICYIPHHFVEKQSSTTTKFRVVFDASAKTSNGFSLNETMMVGPTIQNSLTDILIRFRTHKVAFTADIAKMYRQILVSPQDTDLQRILWRADPTKPVKHYRLRTVTYGTGAAPFLATRVLQELATLNQQQFPRASKVALRDLYVDDLMSGEPNDQDALDTQHQLLSLMKNGAMSLRKWSSNSEAVLNALPPEMRETQTLLTLDTDTTIKTLGICWNPKTDQFQFHVPPTPTSNNPTKRSVLSELARLFDPVGWLSPVVIVGKILMQGLWKLQQGWDEPLPSDIHEQWIRFRSDIQGLSMLTINRFYLQGSLMTCPSLNTANPTSITFCLAGFCDASEKAYAAAIYLCSYDGGACSISLISSKTRVAPLKTVSLPRLELCGANLLADLLPSVKSVLRLPIHSISAHSDSTVTLAWIKSDPSRLKTFVANRVTKVQEKIPSDRWGHVRGEENPADCPSRGISTEELIHHSLWWHGPSWLTKGIPEPTICVPLNHELACEEEKRKITLHTLSTTMPTFLDRRSSLNKLLRVTAFVFRFLKGFKRCHGVSLNPIFSQVNAVLSASNATDDSPCTPFPLIEGSGNLTKSISPLIPSELTHALQYWIKFSQYQEYHREITNLRNGEPVSSKSKLISLSPFLDTNGVLRVGGRLKHSQLPMDRKHPILLSSHSRLTQLLIEAEHLRLFHGGSQLLLSVLQQRYWIIRAKDAIRRQLTRCLTCTKQKAQTMQQIMGDLPSYRVNQSRPFLKCGVDYAGPFSIRSILPKSKITLKAYLAVFVCCTTRAIHLEVVSDLSSEAFLASLRRFISRRGRPSDIYSDCGTNFIGADREMKEMLHLLLSLPHNVLIADQLSKEWIRWHFNPPAAPHFGGLWEAGVKSVKYHLRRIMGSNRLTFEELATTTAQIEAILNSRPITPESNNPEDFSALTPGHFLIGAPITAVPEPNLEDIKMSRLSRWQVLQQMVQVFWRRWSNEYLTRLQQKPKWMTAASKPISIGDMVVIKDENQPPCKWKLGRIELLHPGPDSIVRVVTVKTPTGLLKRPIVKICLLPVDSSAQSTDSSTTFSF